MKTVKKDPPSYKDILKFLAYPQFAGARRGADGPILPSNANAFLKFALGSESGLTEKDFNEEDKEIIRYLIRTASEDGRDYTTYHDYPSGKAPQDVDKFSPEGRVMTTLGRFNFDKDDDGYKVKDNYDFNYSDDNIDRAAGILNMSKDDYIQKYKYNPLGLFAELKRKGVPVETSAYKMLRGSYAPILNELRDPMPVNFKLNKRP